MYIYKVLFNIYDKKELWLLLSSLFPIHVIDKSLRQIRQHFQLLVHMVDLGVSPVIILAIQILPLKKSIVMQAGRMSNNIFSKSSNIILLKKTHILQRKVVFRRYKFVRYVNITKTSFVHEIIRSIPLLVQFVCI